MKTQIKNPYALNQDTTLIHIGDSKKGEKYRCPECEYEVIPRKGNIRVPHFSHKADFDCDNESQLHKTCKLLIKHLVQNQKFNKFTKRSNINISRECSICNKNSMDSIPWDVDNARFEVKLTNNSIADIVLTKDKEIVAAVEIKVTHKVDEWKKESMPIPYVELEGEELISNPESWKPISHNLGSKTCRICKTDIDSFYRRSVRIANSLDMKLPKDYFRYAPSECWRCKKEIMIFDWPHKAYDQIKDSELIRKPKSVRKHGKEFVPKSNGLYMRVEKQWANFCLHCKSWQADWNKDSPLHWFQCGRDDVESFKRDMVIIALQRWEDCNWNTI
ncbi:hypothetical protein KC909_04480 [Candidatus Dojkabacteria bacterium]|uniref:Competence protein CoiA-like N-terminal domain-containing protein n=1 Tax=Candidatus Dojkabacteria bacterium TaxID=2099670 RepID=A0A955L5V6_9BACT|nr:hypothetical protein [Candidatus Dojkabacteria bacterium]